MMIDIIGIIIVALVIGFFIGWIVGNLAIYKECWDEFGRILAGVRKYDRNDIIDEFVKKIKKLKVPTEDWAEDTAYNLAIEKAIKIAMELKEKKE